MIHFTPKTKINFKSNRVSPYGGASNEQLGDMLSEEKIKGERVGKVGIGRFLKEVPSGIAKTFFKEPARLAVSTAEVPGTVKRSIERILGKSTEPMSSQREYNLPLVGKFQSFQSEFEPAYNQAIKPETSALKAYSSVMKPFAEVPLAGLQTGAMAKKLVGDVVLTGENAGQFQKGWIQKPPDIIKRIKKGISSNIEKRKINDALEVVTNQKLSKTEATKSLIKTGKKGGAVEKGVLFKKIETAPDYDDIEAAKAVQGLVKKGGTPTKNISNVSKEIVRVSGEETRPYIEVHSRPLVEDDLLKLDNQLDEIKPNVFTKSNDTANKTFEAIKQGLKDLIHGNAKDDTSLYDTRILYDQMVRQESKGKAFEQTGASYEAIRKSRQVINNFLAKRTPEPEQFLERLNYEHNLFTAIEKIAEKNPNLVGKGMFAVLEQTHPTLVKAGKLIGTGAVGYLGFNWLGSKLSGLGK